jgi:iron complex outermembrane receptor protein
MRRSTFSSALVSICFLAISALGIIPIQAIAQDEASTDDLALEEVTVTATRRRQSLQDVPISIGVVSGEFIQEFNIVDLADFQSYVPGLQIQPTFGSWAVRIRGLGSGITNLAFDSSVPVFLDGVYCGRGKCMESMFLDVDRVEVARGPQGALFGKSTMAGAIAIHSAKPTTEFESWARGGYEVENGDYLIEGAISGPFTDTFSGRLAIRYEDLGGWVENPYVPYDDANAEKLAARASFVWNATDTIDFYLKLETGESDTNGRSNQLVVPGIMSIISTDPDPEYIPDDIRRVSTGVGPEDFYDYEWSLASLSMDVMLGEHTLTAILGYWEYENAWRLDVDGGPDYDLNTDLRDKYDQTTAELRLLSPTGQTIEYIAGIWFQDSNLQARQYSPFSPRLAQFFGGVILGVPDFLLPPDETGGVGMDRGMPSRDQVAWSAYGQLTWNINDRWRIIGDVRYTDETQKASGEAFPSIFPDGYTPEHVPRTYLFHNDEFHFYEERSDDSFDPSLRIQWEVSDNAMIYAGYSQGSKAGGMVSNDGSLGTQLLAKCAVDPAWCQEFVGQSTITAAELAANEITLAQGNTIFDFEDEEGESLELGVKMSLAGGRANLNFAVYTMDFENLQTSSYDGTRFIINNAADASVDGFELEGTWQATNNLRLLAGMAYVDATYGEFDQGQCIITPEHEQQDPDCIDGTEDMSGERLERVPEWEFNFAAQWRSELSANIELIANLSAYYSSDYYVRQDFDPHGLQSSFTKWDARVALGLQDGRWELGITGRNLTDEYTINHAYEILGDEFQSLSRGRTLMLDALFRF